MTPEHFNWDDENKGLPGWYATVACWDTQEGLFPSAQYWNGINWESSSPVVAHAGPFASYNDALAWAREHDPEGLA